MSIFIHKFKTHDVTAQGMQIKEQKTWNINYVMEVLNANDLSLIYGILIKLRNASIIFRYLVSFSL